MFKLQYSNYIPVTMHHPDIAILIYLNWNFSNNFIIHVNLLSTYFCFKTRRTKNIILYKTFSINIESIIISVHCSYMCVYICQHPSNQYWSNIYWDGSFKQDLTFLKNRFLLQVLKQIFVKDSLLRDLSWTTVVCFLKFCKLESKRKANFKCVKNIWISIYM